MSKKVTVYPFHDAFIPVIKYLNVMSSEYKISNVVAPMGFGINGKDAGEAYRKSKTGYIVTNNIEAALLNSDVLLVTDGIKSMAIYDHLISQIKNAITMQKEVICTCKLYDKDLLDLKELSKQKDVSFTYCKEEMQWWDNNKPDTDVTGIEKIDVPVIFIGEVMDGFEGFEMLLQTTLYLQGQGYKVLSIGNPEYSNLFQIETIPAFIYQTGMKEEDKINYFNSYVYHLQKEKNPDVIVIQLPGGLMKYNTMITNEYGVYPFMISQAVRGDYMIYCSHFTDAAPKMFTMLSDTFKYRFGFEINAVNLTNKGLDETDIREKNIELPFVWYEQSIINDTVSKYNRDSLIPFYNCENGEEADILFDEMIHTLSEYGQAVNIV